MKMKWLFMMLVAVVLMAPIASADINLADDAWIDADAATAIASLEAEDLYTDTTTTGTWVSGPGAWAPLAPGRSGW